MKFYSRVREYLLEMARSGFLYHYSTDAISTDMFDSGVFKLSQLYDDAEMERTGDYKYFLSCSRIPRGGYNWMMSEKFTHTIFQLDANKLSYNYKIIPVNASYSDNGAVKYHSDRHKDENEDRVLSKSKQIPFRGNVVAVHQFLPSNISRSPEYKYMKIKMKDVIIPFCRDNNISLYIYNDIAALGHLDIRKATKVV